MLRRAWANGNGYTNALRCLRLHKKNLYAYFKNLDELIIESTDYSMSKVEDDFMEKSPENQLYIYEKALEF